MFAYETEINRIRDAALTALQEESSVAALAARLASAASPSPAEPLSGVSPTERAGVQDRLSQGLMAASLAVVAAALADSQEAMAFSWPRDGNETRNGHLPVDAAPQPSIPRLVDAALELSLQTPPLAEAGLSARLLEAVCEAVPAQQCSGVFACLEARVAIFQRPALRARVAQTVLRTANAALRRLSKSQSAMAGGKILLFLARFNPLADRSGTNFQGLYNAENATPVEELGTTAPLDHEGRPVDPVFYRTFWGLQELFARPPSALAPGGWERARLGLDAVLGWLETHPLAEGREAPPGSSLGISVKFLSTARLLHLELEDLTFRRHVLVQALILLRFCAQPFPKPGAAQGLRGAALEQAQALEARVWALLESAPEAGLSFAAGIRAQLREEAAWAAWKQRGCPTEVLERTPACPPPAAEATHPLGPPLEPPRPSAEATFGVTLGDAALDRLWNLTADNTSMLAAEDRGGFKTVRALLEPVLEDWREGGEGELARDPMYSWRTLRLVAREDLKAYFAAASAEGDLRQAARALYPDECPALEQEKEAQREEQARDEDLRSPSSAPREQAASAEGEEGPSLDEEGPSLDEEEPSLGEAGPSQGEKGPSQGEKGSSQDEKEPSQGEKGFSDAEHLSLSLSRASGGPSQAWAFSERNSASPESPAAESRLSGASPSESAPGSTPASPLASPSSSKTNASSDDGAEPSRSPSCEGSFRRALSESSGQAEPGPERKRRRMSDDVEGLVGGSDGMRGDDEGAGEDSAPAAL